VRLMEGPYQVMFGTVSKGPENRLDGFGEQISNDRMPCFSSCSPPLQRIAERPLSSDNRDMLAEALISARVTAETKQRFAELARRQGLSQSALMKRLVETALASVLRALEALRDHFRKLLDANSRSWEMGYAKAPD